DSQGLAHSPAQSAKRQAARQALLPLEYPRPKLRPFLRPYAASGGKWDRMFVRSTQSSVWLTALGLLISQPCLEGAEGRLAGREIFRQQCAKCHGRNGEGVKGKYDDHLHGDWS